MPARKSRYRLPVLSSTQAPSPRTSIASGGGDERIMAALNRSDQGVTSSGGGPWCQVGCPSTGPGAVSGSGAVPGSGTAPEGVPGVSSDMGYDLRADAAL